MTNALTLDPGEREAILETFDHRPQPSVNNYAPLGWPIMLGALALQGLTVWILGRLHITLSSGARFGLLLATGALVLIGLGVMVLGGSAVHSVPKVAAEEAIGTLISDAASDPATRRQAAVTLLANAFYSGGAWTLSTYDAAAVAERLGTQLAYVQAVETVLRDERGIWPVFTA